MEIVVLVKQVPDTESMIQIADDGVSIKTQDIKWVMNPYDEFAVEEALRIKEALGGTVTILSMGWAKAQETIRTALAMGADKGIHIEDPALEKSDPLATAKILAAALKQIPYDLIIAGQRAVDDDSYIVGPAVAQILGIPNVSMVIEQKIQENKILCTRTVEGGTEVVEAELPALFTTQRGLNEPRYASLPGIMKAKKKPLEKKSLADLGIDSSAAGTAGSKLEILSLKLPPAREAIEMVEGETAQEKAANLVKLLHEKVKII